MNAGALSRSARTNRVYDDAFRFRHSQTSRQVGSHASYRDSKLAAANLSVLSQLIHDSARHVGGNGETDSDAVATVTRHNLRVNSDQLSDGIHQRAARVAVINRRIRLQKVFEVATPKVAWARAALRADNSHRHRLPNAEGITNRQRDVAHSNFV